MYVTPVSVDSCGWSVVARLVSEGRKESWRPHRQLLSESKREHGFLTQSVARDQRRNEWNEQAFGAGTKFPSRKSEPPHPGETRPMINGSREALVSLGLSRGTLRSQWPAPLQRWRAGVVEAM